MKLMRLMPGVVALAIFYLLFQTVNVGTLQTLHALLTK